MLYTSQPTWRPHTWHRGWDFPVSIRAGTKSPRCLQDITPLMGKSYIQLALSQLVLPQGTPGQQSNPQTIKDGCAFLK